jgi:hypothetical protein
MVAAREKPHYVNNQEFLQLLIEYKRTGKRKDLNKLGVIFLKIANGMMNRPNFINYSNNRKCEMISDSTYFMVKYLAKYDVTKSNPFAYFSQICYNAFIQSINKENKLSKDFISISFIDNLDGEEFQSRSRLVHENHSAFMLPNR